MILVFAIIAIIAFALFLWSLCVASGLEWDDADIDKGWD